MPKPVVSWHNKLCRKHVCESQTVCIFHETGASWFGGLAINSETCQLRRAILSAYAPGTKGNEESVSSASLCRMVSK